MSSLHKKTEQPEGRPERHLDGRTLSEVLGGIVPAGVDGISGVTHDSRSVGEGYAFVAVPGFKHDGVEFVPQALRGGASLVVAEREVPGAPVVVVPDARAALASLACAFYGNPSTEMDVYGVTGTNGKTTTSYVLHGILAGVYGEPKCGLMTTAETIVAGEREQSRRTTPEATEVQGTLARMRDAGVSRVVMEVSSHGVALQRVSGTKFAGSIFTNLTRDHLDLHGTMEEYYRAKRELFYRTDGPKLANIEDEWGRRLAGEVDGAQTFGASPEADYEVRNVRVTGDGTEFDLVHPKGKLHLVTPLLGNYNVSNVAGAASLALATGVEEERISIAAAGMGQVPGRFERVVNDAGFEVIVDYAHTDVGLEAVLKVARAVAGVNEVKGANGANGGRVICVFGAAGERDGAKRPLMGEVASRLADGCIVTTDDAYGESPEDIAAEVYEGIPHDMRGEHARVIIDRREAIRAALDSARKGDVVVVAGKGHERVQHLPGGDIPFHDASVVGELLRESSNSRSGI